MPKEEIVCFCFASLLKLKLEPDAKGWTYHDASDVEMDGRGSGGHLFYVRHNRVEYR